MQTPITTDELRTKIAGLATMDKAALLEVWKITFSSPPPSKLRKELMVPILAYRMQEVVLGGMSQMARRRLQLLVEQRAAAPSGATKKPPVAKARAKLVRTWHGETHEVFITDDGYVYRDEAFQSLSPIARRITGTQWSGPAFFGTRATEKKQ